MTDRYANPRRRRWLRLRSVTLALTLLVALATPVAAQDGGDPLEPVNRAVFAFNQTIDGMFLEPAAIAYRLVVPQPVRTGVGNFLTNLAAPVVLANDLLQGEFMRAHTTFGRFMINTIIGGLGIVDVATRIGMPPPHFEDFGQTLGSYGIGSGPYLVLPLLGPSNPRDAAGRVVDILISPRTYVAPGEANLAVTGTGTVHFREENLETFEELEDNSLDLYATLRSAYQQQRAAAIRNGAPPAFEDDIYDLPDE